MRREKVVRAREFRRRATPAERAAWKILRNRQLLGLKFRRQHLLHGFIVDFYCPSLRIVLEIDGGLHTTDQQEAADRDRTAILEAGGLTVVRVKNENIDDTTLKRLLEPYLGNSTPGALLPAKQPRQAFPLSRSAGEGARG